jgi:hypothetical protein
MTPLAKSRFHFVRLILSMMNFFHMNIVTVQLGHHFRYSLKKKLTPAKFELEINVFSFMGMQPFRHSVLAIL